MSDTEVSLERVVVFDDPVSSLDSDALFIVSSLVREMVMSVADDSNPIKQLFVLTHNVYFQKEVSYDKWLGWSDENEKKLSCPPVAYWVVTKRDRRSTVQKYEANPVKSSYELLWAEIYGKDSSSIGVQNCMRRVLEHYFGFVGCEFKMAIVRKFSVEDRHICRSLLSWVNDGSHSVVDDLHAPMSDISVEMSRHVFKRVFHEMEHGAHHEMMMNAVLNVGA